MATVVLDMARGKRAALPAPLLVIVPPALMLALSLAPPLLAQMNPPPDSTALRTRATTKDSLAAQKSAYTAIRQSNHRTGTLAFRAMMKARAAPAVEAALKIIPGDEWLSTARLAFPTPAVRRYSPAEIRATCRAASWWCDLQYSRLLLTRSSFDEADRALNAAISAMSPMQKCIWDDIAPLISDKSQRARYERMSCEERAPLNENFWWLADPMYSVPGNERRVEHHAREVALRISRETGLIWSPGFPRGLLLIRYSTSLFNGTDAPTMEWAELSEEEEVAPGSKAREGFLERIFRLDVRADIRAADFWRLDSYIRLNSISDGPPDYLPSLMQFSPRFAAVHNPFRAVADDWELNPRESRERGFSSVGWIIDLDHQHAFFHRGDSARLVVVADASVAPTLRSARPPALLVWSRSPAEVPNIVRATGGPRYQLSPWVPRDSMLVSLEILGGFSGNARVRFGAVPPVPRSRVHLSDIALLGANTNTAPPPPDARLDHILNLILPTTRVAEGGTVGLFWEMYGLRGGEEPTISLIVRAQSDAQAERDRTLTDTSSTRGERRTTYQDVAASGNEVEPRQLSVNLEGLRPGYYLLQLRVEVPGEAAAYSTRRIQVIRSR